MLETIRRSRDKRVSDRRRRILSAIAHAEVAGPSIAKRARIAIAFLHPELIAMEKEGILASRWDDAAPVRRGAPRLRLYKAVKPECGPWG